MEDFIASPNVGDEVSKTRNRYRFDGVGWTPVSRASIGGAVAITKHSWMFSMAEAQVIVSGKDLGGVTLDYATNADIEVYIEGMKAPKTDFTLTSSGVITLANSSSAGDKVEIIQSARFSVSDHYTKAEVDSKMDESSDLKTYYLGSL